MKEFDEIYDEEITKRYDKYEIQRLSKRKDRKRDIGAGRPFKLDLENRFLMILVYYRLYITYTLAGFLFDLDQGNICRDIHKIESLIRQSVPIPQKTYGLTKRLKTPEEVEKYFPGLLAFIDSTEQQQIPRPSDNKRKKDVLFRQEEEKTYCKDTIYGNNRSHILHKVAHKKGKRHDYDVYKKDHPIIPKEVVTVVNQ